MTHQFLGLGKTKFNSSICLINDSHSEAPIELLLTERLNRKKNSGSWPEIALKKIFKKLAVENLIIGENRDTNYPKTIEDKQNEIFPFYEYIKKNRLDFFVSHYNSNIKFVTHHLCHAYAALAMSPFEKSVIVVMDGAGSELDENEYEECTVFLQDGVNLSPVLQQSVVFQNELGNRVGTNYERASEYIFNSPHCSGKVMGLAPYGRASRFNTFQEFQDSLEEGKSFKGHSKKDWEMLDHALFKNISASIQLNLEIQYEKIISTIKEKYPNYENLVLTGGCALNCTNNAKIYYTKSFRKMFIPPFPGDESVSFGLAHYLKYAQQPESWRVVPLEKQSAYLGPIDSIPTRALIEKEFLNDHYDLQFFPNIVEVTARLLSEKNIIAWFQGRSESGPRALGNRSILAHPEITGLKVFLNQNIKFRENFRPYGCSVLHDKSHLYFDVEENFDNPYMSYAIKIREEFSLRLNEVSHIDGTSRMQTVRIGQNEKFYKLIEEFGNRTDLYCLLNTSLNVMDEPILETVSDARRFMDNTVIEYLIIDNYLIKRKI